MNDVLGDPGRQSGDTIGDGCVFLAIRDIVEPEYASEVHMIVSEMSERDCEGRSFEEFIDEYDSF
jgi:hypothetical protein